MRASLSIPQMLAELQSQIAFHREQEELHAGHEALHREKRAFHAAELQTALERFQAFESAAAAAGELVERHRTATAPAAPSPDVPAWSRRPVGLLVTRVVDSQRPEETFGPSQIAEEVNRLYGAKLSAPVDGRAVSVTLRRLAAAGRLHLLREGTAHREALYSKTPPSGKAE
ncbi:MAG TPA: hypothetical protein VIA62_09960 [Thermoanaerobaculia bacterium]|jgi:hypothetical protein|nr:hypothetical protein [Thermoanaerobaculia bacterium]